MEVLSRLVQNRHLGRFCTELFNCGHPQERCRNGQGGQSGIAKCVSILITVIAFTVYCQINFIIFYVIWQQQQNQKVTNSKTNRTSGEKVSREAVQAFLAKKEEEKKRQKGELTWWLYIQLIRNKFASIPVLCFCKFYTSLYTPYT